MTRENLNTALSVLSALLATGLVPLWIYVGNRKSQIRLTDTQSGVNKATAVSTEIEASSKLITQLQQDGETYRGIVRDVQAELERLKERHERDQKEFAAKLTIAHEENQRLTVRVAQLQTDLDIAVRQLEDLRKLI